MTDRKTNDVRSISLLFIQRCSTTDTYLCFILNLIKKYSNRRIQYRQNNTVAFLSRQTERNAGLEKFETNATNYSKNNIRKIDRWMTDRKTNDVKFHFTFIHSKMFNNR